MPPPTGGDIAQPDARERLRQHFLAENTPKRWDDLWAAGTFLPWDRGTPNPALIDVLETRKDLLGEPLVEGHRKKVLVPGCGKGYDVYLFAACGYDAVGLEGSKHALEACEGFRGEVEGKEEYRVRDEKVGRGSVRFVEGDFFKSEWEGGVADGGFDVIYDYTVSLLIPRLYSCVVLCNGLMQVYEVSLCAYPFTSSSLVAAHVYSSCSKRKFGMP